MPILTRKEKETLDKQIAALKIKAEDYTNLEKDFGFLTLILSRKKNITKEYLINIYSRQKSDTDYIQDEEIEPIISQVVEEVLSQIGDSYKNFLIEKYFGTYENLVIFVTEDVYVDLTSSAISRNIEKINKNVRKSALDVISKINVN